MDDFDLDKALEESGCLSIKVTKGGGQWRATATYKHPTRRGAAAFYTLPVGFGETAMEAMKKVVRKHEPPK